MAADPKVWSSRVEDWRASGMSAKDFARGKGFSESALRYWASRLRRESAERSEAREEVRIARVVRSVPTSVPRVLSAKAVGPIAIEVGALRVIVERGFDPAVLGAVLDVIEERERAHGGRS